MAIPKPQPNKLIKAMQQVINKQPMLINGLNPGLTKSYLGVWVSAEPLDANLSVVQLQGGAIIHFVAKSTGDSFSAGDVVKLEKSPNLPIHIVGKLRGNINLATGASVSVSAPGPPSGLHVTSTSTTSITFAWTAGIDHIGSGLAYQVFDELSATSFPLTFKGQTGVGTLSYNLTGLQHGTEYQIALKAIDGLGQPSKQSAVLLATTDGSPPVGSGTSVTKSYKATVLRSYNYNANRELNSWHNGSCYQGVFGGSASQFGLMFFDWNQIHKDTAGVSMTGASLSVTYAHWARNSGGTAIIGTHEYVSPPNTVSTGNFASNQWSTHSNVGSAIKVNLGTSFANSIANGIGGNVRGIMIGPGPTSSSIYYGYTWGAGSHVPVLTLSWITN